MRPVAVVGTGKTAFGAFAERDLRSLAVEAAQKCLKNAKVTADRVEALYLDPGRPGARIAPEAEAAYVRALRARGVEWIALAGFLRIVGRALLDAFPGRILNIHPSLLPAFPGLDAQGQAWRHGVKVAGCTVHFVDAGVDTGPIVLQAAVPVRDDDDEAALRARILDREHAIYVEALRLAVTGRLRREGRRVRITQAEEVVPKP